MLSFTLFTFSGVVIVILTIAKRVEEKHKKSLFVLKAISMGDEWVRQIHHEVLHHYSISKDRSAFWLKKQLPLKIKSLWNKCQAYVREKSVAYLGDVRGSKLLKRSDGISEFFKNISDIEKGTGQINEDFYTEETEEPSVKIIKTRTKTLVEPMVVIEKPITPVKIKKPRVAKKRAIAPRKKVPVVEVLD